MRKMSKKAHDLEDCGKEVTRVKKEKNSLKQNQKPLVVQEKQRRNRKKEKMGVQAWKKMYLVSVEERPSPGSPVERSL